MTSRRGDEFLRGFLLGVIVCSCLGIVGMLIWWTVAAYAVTVVGHRAEEGVNENTLAALAHDREWGARFETDQWNLKDGTPVILHDPTLRRTVDPASMPAGVTPDSMPRELTLWQWHQLRTYGGQPLPTLHAWINHAAQWHVRGMVEIKWVPPDPALVASWVADAGAHVTFYAHIHYYDGACHPTAADAMLAAGVVMGLKATAECPLTLQEAKDAGYAFVITSSSLLTSAYVGQAHELGLKAGNYISPRKVEWRRLADAGVDYLLVPHVKRAVIWKRRHGY